MAENRNIHIHIKKMPFFFQLSILVHPDKNQDDADRAQKAFEGRFLVLQIIKGNWDNFPFFFHKKHML